MHSYGHTLAARLIRKHGVDRYPTPELQALKLCEEVGELAGAILKDLPSQSKIRIRKELADVALALFALGTKLELDVMEEMDTVVKQETRTFG